MGNGSNGMGSSNTASHNNGRDYNNSSNISSSSNNSRGLSNNDNVDEYSSLSRITGPGSRGSAPYKLQPDDYGYREYGGAAEDTIL